MSENGWAEVKKSNFGSGIRQLEIYRIGDSLFIIMETSDDFEFDKNNAMDAANLSTVLEEDNIGFSVRLARAKEGEKWVLTDIKLK